jgi:hypothetical protein
VILLYFFVQIVQGILLNGDNLRIHVSKLLVPFWSDARYEHIARGDWRILTGFEKVAAFLHSAVFWAVDALIAGAILSWVIGAFTAMFLIFRKEVDGTDYSDIVRGEQPS